MKVDVYRKCNQSPQLEDTTTSRNKASSSLTQAKWIRVRRGDSDVILSVK
jgi:hypothetical protein